jgi:hypothetical protein
MPIFARHFQCAAIVKFLSILVILSDDNMNQSNETMLGNILYAIIGFAIPLVMIAAYILLGWGTLPLVIIALSWLSVAIIFHMGVTDQEISG